MIQDNVTTTLYDPVPVQTLITKHEELGYPYACEFGGATLIIDEDVFCPTLTNASPLLLSAVDFRPNELVLDAFAGSGAFGVIAALHGSRAVAFDISAHAVACAKRNVERNHVAHRVEVREGAIQSCIAKDEQFDLVIANPPLLPGKPLKQLEVALFDPRLEATLRFIKSLRHNLKADGRCYLLTSDVFARYGYDIDTLCAESGLRSTIAQTAGLGYEEYRVHKIVRVSI
jgi:methylase of polypeptide subunit release factors